MKNMKRILALALVVVSVLSISIPAMAADSITLTAKPGKNDRTAGYDSDSFSVSCTVGGSGNTVNVFLDTFSTSRNDWVKRKTKTFTSDGTATLSYTLSSTDTKARIRIYAYKENTGSSTVVVTPN